ncbi:hypothetical protein AB0436_12950 [Streptomyces sp. NPDC051322]|uniref:hypothetical protein n=1 Tax=Streptomyces sp. NPDC051322 TaxID=3154645 RepID=UPI00344B1C15
MTTRAQRQQRPAHPLVGAFVRFVVCGGGVGLASSGVLLLLHGRIPLVVANALITVVSTVVATELHGRISFRDEHTARGTARGWSGWAVHLQSGLTVAVSYGFTTVALLGLYAVRSGPSALTEQAVYLAASALAGIGRFVVLRAVVFAGRGATTVEPVGGAAAAGPMVMAA